MGFTQVYPSGMVRFENAVSQHLMVIILFNLSGSVYKSLADICRRQLN